MGNYKFRLSDMIPNAWFYKLKNGVAPQPVKNNNNKHKNLQYHHYLITPTPTSSTTPYHQTAAQITHPRHSYYFTREPYTKSIDTNDHVVLHNSSSPTNPKVSDLHYIAATEPPRRSRPKSRRRTVNNKSVSSVPLACNCRDQLSPSTASKSDSTPDYSAVASPELIDSQESAESARVDTNSMSVSSSTTTSCSCRVSDDIIIDIIDSKKSSSAEKFDGFDPITELELPPIITKAPTKFSPNKEEQRPRRRISASKGVAGEKNVHGSVSSKEQKSGPFVRKSISGGSPGLKLRSNSPRILTRKVRSKDMTMTFLGAKPNKQRTTTTTGTKNQPAVTATTIASNVIPVSSMNKNVSDSYAIIKSSFDPQREFRESMVEMIVENNLRKSGDLEELLACYLSLNSNEYHDIIVKVFEQIWFDLTDIH